jgi:hypothetical protein
LGPCNLLNPPNFNRVHTKAEQLSCISELRVSMLSFSTIFLLDLRNVPTV